MLSLKKMSPDAEEFARFLADLIAGRRYTSGEAAAFEGGPSSRTFAVRLANIARTVLPPNPGRTKLVIQNRDAAIAAEMIDGENSAFGTGLEVMAGATYIDDENVFKGAVVLIAGAAGPIDVRVREESS